MLDYQHKYQQPQPMHAVFLSKCVKILVAIILSLMFTISLANLTLCLWENFDLAQTGRLEVNLWLSQNELSQYKELFELHGKHIFYSTERWWRRPDASVIFLINYVLLIARVENVRVGAVKNMCRDFSHDGARVFM